MSKLDEDELFIAERIMPYHRHIYLPVYAFTYMYACIHVAYMYPHMHTYAKEYMYAFT